MAQSNAFSRKRLNELAVLIVDLSVPLVAQWYKVYARNFWRKLYSAVPLDYFRIIHERRYMPILIHSWYLYHATLTRPVLSQIASGN